MFRCVVRKFDAVHDFGAFKSAGFKVQEMGESVARAVFKNELGLEKIEMNEVTAVVAA